MTWLLVALLVCLSPRVVSPFTFLGAQPVPVVHHGEHGPHARDGGVLLAPLKRSQEALLARAAESEAQLSGLAGARLAGVVGIATVPAHSLAPEDGAEAFVAIVNACKWARHDSSIRGQSLASTFSASERINWYFFGIVLSVLIAMDAAILQHLPETCRTHLVLLFFWLLVAVAVCLEVWLRLGPQAGMNWFTGYIFELMFSADSVLVLHVIFCTFETPRRLTCKAMFVWLLGAILSRLAFFLGAFAALGTLRAFPVIVGLWLLYTGSRHISARDDEGADVTQAMLVRAAARVLGDRFGQFYDEDGEALLAECKGRTCATLLSVVVFSLLAADLFLALDVVLAKADAVPSIHLNFASSALALFAVRALFFVARDMFNRCSGSKYGVGVAILFLGVEAVVAQAFVVSVLVSLAVVVLIIAVSVAAPARWPGKSEPRASAAAAA